MMKKIIILLAILACGVGQAGAQRTDADNIKIYVNKDNVTTNEFWSEVKLYYWDNGTNGISTATVQPTTETFDGKTWYVFAMNPEYAGKISFLLHDGTLNGSHQTDDYTTPVYNDTFFYINWNGVGNKCKLDQNKNYMYLYRTSDKKSFLMTPGGSDNFSLRVDNQTEVSADFCFVLATNNAYKQDGTGEINWNDNDAKSTYWRPGQIGDNKVLGFENVSSFDCWSNSGQTNSFDISNKPFVYDIVFNRPNDNWNSSTISVSPYFTRTINTSVGYSTFSSDYAVAIPEGVTAYYASGANSSTKKVTMTKFTNGIAANSGALLYKLGGGEVTFTPATLTDAATGNLMKPGTGDVVASEGTTYRYALAKNGKTSEIYFAKLAEGSTNTVAKGKAYLEVTSGGAAPSLSIFFDDAAGGTTAIDAVKSAEPAVTDGAYYNLAGQRVTNPKKGLYIVNGRKVVVK